MSKREKPKWQSIDHFVPKSVASTQLPDDPDTQHTIDEDASSEESSNMAFPQEIETERSSAESGKLQWQLTPIPEFLDPLSQKLWRAQY